MGQVRVGGGAPYVCAHSPGTLAAPGHLATDITPRWQALSLPFISSTPARCPSYLGRRRQWPRTAASAARTALPPGALAAAARRPAALLCRRPLAPPPPGCVHGWPCRFGEQGGRHSPSTACGQCSMGVRGSTNRHRWAPSLPPPPHPPVGDHTAHGGQKQRGQEADDDNRRHCQAAAAAEVLDELEGGHIGQPAADVVNHFSLQGWVRDAGEHVGGWSAASAVVGHNVFCSQLTIHR